MRIDLGPVLARLLALSCFVGTSACPAPRRPSTAKEPPARAVADLRSAPVKGGRARPGPTTTGCLERSAWLPVALARQKAGIELCFRITRVPQPLSPSVERATVDFVVGQTGEVITALLVQSVPPNPRRDVCLMRALRETQLPRLCSAPLSLSYTFNFDPAHQAPPAAP